MSRSERDRALTAIYRLIPEIPDCDGGCVESCGPIAMFDGEWARVKRAARRTPVMAKGQMTCPLLSPTGRCTVYSVRPYICRLWGTTPELACPHGCMPQRWLGRREAQEIYAKIAAIAGPGIAGPLGDIDDLWEAIGLERREQRSRIIAAWRGTRARPS